MCVQEMRVEVRTGMHDGFDNTEDVIHAEAEAIHEAVEVRFNT
jgi:hypothetical protein